MELSNSRAGTGSEPSVTIGNQDGQVLLFGELGSFSQAVQLETGLSFNFVSVVTVNADFLEASDRYLILNVRDAADEAPNNLLFATEQKAFLFSKKPPLAQAFEPFKAILPKAFGPSTILAFLVLHRVLDSCKATLENLSTQIGALDESFDYTKYRTLAAAFERLDDRSEELHDLLLRLEERNVKHVESDYISFDYSVLIAESVSLEGRCRRRISVLQDLARDHEMRASAQLNQRIEKLNDVVRILTAITVILMIPTLIASHFGMNFVYMPELKLHWAYPVVIAAQLVFMGLGVAVFKKIGWL